MYCIVFCILLQHKKKLTILKRYRNYTYKNTSTYMS